MSLDRDPVSQFAESLDSVPDGEKGDAPVLLPEGLGEDFLRFLESGNGGVTRDKMLYFFGKHGPTEHNIVLWNKTDLWKSYFGLDDTFFVIAEDCLGNQYGYTLGKRRRSSRF